MGASMRAILAGCYAALLTFTAQAAELPPGYAQNNQPQTPFKISDDIYYVGASDVTAFLIDGGDGLILTDGGFEQTAPIIEANIKVLGFDIKKVKVLLNSHAHFDHAGGLAALKAASGAKLYASQADKGVLENGGKAQFDGADTNAFPAVRVDENLKDGQKLSVGRASLTIHLTPGHTRGCTSWTMTTRVAGKPTDVLFVCSLTALPQYRLVKNPSYAGIAEDFRSSVKTLRSLPCDIGLGSHGIFFNMKAKAAKVQAGQVDAFVDPQGCRAYLDTSAKLIEAEIAKERAE